MKIILLSGGSGKRLWPMSNDSRSKQFLKVLDDGQGKLVSMLQRVWSQLAAVGLRSDTYICASKSQREIIESQVGVCPFIEEPSRRDTFGAIALATQYLTDVVGYDEDEVVAVLPIDPMVDNSYFEAIRTLPDVLDESKAELALLGVRPSEPSSKFGYIQVSSSTLEKTWMHVDSFVEKPDREDAEQLIVDGALWNCGVFCFRIGYMKQALTEQGYPDSYTSFLQSFASLPKRSFDYEVVEKAKSIAVLPYSGQWKDLGTWESLSSEIQNEFIGIGQSNDCEDTHVINELGVPLITMGLKDTIVVASPDGILVSAKPESSSIKSIVKFYGNRPMFEERRWGSYRVLDYVTLSDGTEVLTRSVELSAGRNISYHKHMIRSEVWTIIDGHGEVIIDTRIVPVHAGDVLRIHSGEWHAIRAESNLSFIEVQQGETLVEEDVIRRYIDWNEISEHCGILA